MRHSKPWGRPGRRGPLGRPGRGGGLVAVGAAMCAVALVAAGCGGNTTGGSDGGGSGGMSTAPLATGTDLLKDVCPSKVAIQLDWFPESEYGGYFHLLGPNPKIDNNKKSITGELLSQGKDTGVTLQIRSGGPAIGYQQVSAQMYVDKSINLGVVPTDESVQNSLKQPTTAVFAPFDISPIMIMWDKKQYPNFRSIVDIGQTNTKVLYYQTDTYMQYLLGAGILKSSQIDGSYDGSPSRWVASGGKVALSGFATSEPYIYAHELGNGQSYDVDLQLVNDTGYPMYGESLVVRSGDLTSMTPCLKRLVPILQQGWVSYMASPVATNALIVRDVQSGDASTWTYSPGLASFAVQAMKNRGIVSNGNNSTLGDMQSARVQRMIDILTPIFAGQKKDLKPGLKPSDLFTNQFLNAGIGLKN
jgi:hypothetical protein